jgi:hypothetical protein
MIGTVKQAYNNLLNTEDYWQLLLICTIGWFALAVGAHLIPIPGKTSKKILDMQNRMVSMVHGFIIVGCAYYEVFVAQNDVTKPNTHFHCIMGAWSCAYFIHDTVMMLILGLAD